MGKLTANEAIQAGVTLYVQTQKNFTNNTSEKGWPKTV